jgi:hypothetical protein
MRLVSRSRAFGRWLAGVTFMVGAMLIPQKVFGQG